MPKPIFEKDLKLGFMVLNKMLSEQKYKQYKFNGTKVLEEDFKFENKKQVNKKDFEKKQIKPKK